MSIIENTKEIAELIKKMGNIDLYKRIIELEGEIIDLSREKHQLDIKLNQLEKQFEQEQEMKFRKPFYYKEGDNVPCCPLCWEANRKAVHLDGPNRVEMETTFYCYLCRNNFVTKASESYMNAGF